MEWHISDTNTRKQTENKKSKSLSENYKTSAIKNARLRILLTKNKELQFKILSQRPRTMT